MFTGIVQDVGSIVAIDVQDKQTRMCFATSLNMQSWVVGDSVAVNGCCLTVTDFPQKAHFQATLSQETLHCTSFSQLVVGDVVNLEPALRVGDALGGHMVSGHVDALGHVHSMLLMGEHMCLSVTLPLELMPMLAVKGSVCIHGVSLTVNSITNDSFMVNLIPHTLKATSLNQLKKGDALNIEVDIMARYAQRLLGLQLVTEENT